MMTAVGSILVLLDQLVGDDEAGKAAVAAIRDELAADEQAIADLKAQVAAIPEPAPAFDPSALEAEIAALGVRVSALEGLPTDANLAARVSALEARNAADDGAAGTLAPPDGAPGFSPATLPDAVVGEAYSALLTPMGGVAPYAVSIASGALPDGLSLGAGGQISGTPTTSTVPAAGPDAPAQFSVQAHDANNLLIGPADYSLSVAAAPAVA